MANRRDEILEAAKKLFAQRSYHTVSLEDVSKYLQMGKSTLYHYFSTKEELFSEMVGENIATLQKYLEQRVDQKTGPEDKLQELVAALLEYFEENRDFFLITVREKMDFLKIKVQRNGRNDTVRASLDDSIKEFSSIITEGKKTGAFVQADSAVIFSSVIGTVTTVALDVIVYGREAKLTDLTGDCWKVISGGILA